MNTFLLSSGDDSQRSSGELVFKILANQFPLTATEIQELLRARYKRKLTLQAVSKATNKFVREGVLTRHEGKLLISRRWLNQTKQLIDSVSSRYQEGSLKPVLTASTPGQEISIFKTHSLYETDRVWGEIFLQLFEEKRKQPGRPCMLTVSNLAWGHPSISVERANYLRTSPRALNIWGYDFCMRIQLIAG